MLISMMLCSKLFSINLYVAALAALYCCFQLLFLQVTLCASNCSSSSMQCANLGNLTYPFGGSASCASSPSFVLSNCTSSTDQAYWDSFSPTATGVVGSPAVTRIAHYDDYGYYKLYGGYVLAGGPKTSIQLSWNKTLLDLDYCTPPFSSTNLSLYNIPSSINLTRFPDSSALVFSPTNTYLLFNCTHKVSSNVVAQFGNENFEAESVSGCSFYKGLCTSLAKTPCIQWSVPTSNGKNPLHPMKELMLQHVLDRLACSHFMLGITSIDSQWSTGSIELIWKDIECEKCRHVGGGCIYTAMSPIKFDYCNCSTQTCSIVVNDPGSLDTDCHGGLLHCNTGVKIGFAVAAVVVVLGIFIVIGVKHKVKLRNLGRMKESMRAGFRSFINDLIPIVINVLKKSLRKLQSVSIGPNYSLNIIDFDGLTERPMEYSYSAIASATKSFSSIVGEGGFGTVYKGTLISQASSHGGLKELQIAVKVLEVRSKHRKKQILNEVVTIGRIHHVNVVRLLGFCMQEDHEMLVYEYMVNGSLDRWLFDKKGKAQEQVLDWEQRHAIALGVARGLSYLHEECRHRTVHCDIKPQNILLDEDMRPKIADFGLARLMDRDESKVVTFAKGTPGYIAPEFWMGGESQLSTKFDVYSYGMLLLELISGQRNFRRDAWASHGSSFPAMAYKAAIEGDLESILDARLGITSDGDEAQKQAHWHQIKTAAFVALWCIQDHPSKRPPMSEVVKYLEGGAAISEVPPQPNISISSTSPPPQELYSSGSHLDNYCTPLSVGR